MPRQRTIFVSCGQLSNDEKTLGRGLGAAIERHGMKSFFAEDVHSTGALNTIIFKAIQTCDAFLGVLQKRGTVTYKDYPKSERSSVWIQQEIAVFSYRLFLEDRALPIRIYSERGIRREGVMEVAIVNAIEFESTAEVLTDVDKWLEGREFEEHPVVARREDLFRRRMVTAADEHWLLLEIVAAHTEPGTAISNAVVRQDFLSVSAARGLPERESEPLFDRVHSELHRWRVLVGISDGVMIGRQWWNVVLDELRNQGRRI
jgi:hypothetical protein